MIAPVWSRTRSFAIELPAGLRSSRDLDLLELDVGAAGHRDDVEERGHLRLRDQVRHLQAGGGVRLDDAVGAGELQLRAPSGRRSARATTKSSGAIALRAESVMKRLIVVRVGRRDEPARAPDARPLEVRVLGSVAEHDERAVRLRRLRARRR